jgi:hypothetical protein
MDFGTQLDGENEFDGWLTKNKLQAYKAALEEEGYAILRMLFSARFMRASVAQV